MIGRGKGGECGEGWGKGEEGGEWGEDMCKRGELNRPTNQKIKLILNIFCCVCMGEKKREREKREREKREREIEIDRERD